jgi:hypothetical protein
MEQSSNDVIPTALHLSGALAIKEDTSYRLLNLDSDFLTAKMGRDSINATDFFNGIIDEVKIFKYPSGNQVPNKPAKPSGEINAKVGTSYTYTTSTTDPDGDNIEYL